MMKRRELFKRTLLGTIGAAVGSAVSGKGESAHGTHATHSASTREFPPDYDFSQELARPDWKPIFLDAHQNETLTVLSDLIIPTTDTPGAKDALVNRFIDHLLAAETHQTQRGFIEGLSFIDGECIKRYGSAFVHLKPELQVEFLRFIAYPHRLVTWGETRAEFAGYRHFSRLKDWISRAYYRSAIGMEELGWDGNFFHGSFDGCDHSDGNH